MKVHVKITDIDIVNELTTYWSNTDYINLLKKMDFQDAESSSPEELKDLVLMGLTDFEPNEAASLLLTYKLGDELNEGQIHTISYEMIDDKIAEEYPDPALHYDIYNINQLLYKAYNGTFPNTEAIIIKLDLQTDQDTEINNEVLIKAICGGLSDRSLILRLYSDQIKGEAPFDTAEKIIWLFTKESENEYVVITSKYWIDKEDIVQFDYDTTIEFHLEDE